MAHRCYKWSVQEKLKLVKRYKEHGWNYNYYMDFGCSWQTCRRELIRLGYIKED